MTLVSVIIPTYNEEKYIAICLESIIGQDFPKEKMEVFFVDGQSTDHTREIIQGYTARFSYIFLLQNPKKFVPYAMNKGIQEAKGDFIIRLDAHTVYPKNYFSCLIRSALELNADNVGGICNTEVLNKTAKSLAIKEVLMNRFGVGNSVFRVGANTIIEVDTVPFGCFRKDVFQRFGYYNELLIRNQDIELNKRIKHGGGKIFLVPTIHCTYYARETFNAISKNNFLNGYWNILTVYYTRNFKSLSVRHFVPLIFILGLLIPIIASVFYLPLIFLSTATFFLYVVLFTIISLTICLKKNLKFQELFTAFLVLHVSYGIGSLTGLLKLPFLRRRKIH